MMTAGVAALIGDVTRFRGFQKRAELLRAVRDYDNFDIDNDPYGERDYGIFEFESATRYWKIDYYDRALAVGSENPSDPNDKTRVLTNPLAEGFGTESVHWPSLAARLGLARQQRDGKRWGKGKERKK